MWSPANRSCQTELASTAHSPVSSEVPDTETPFYRAAAENRSKIRACGDGRVRGVALGGDCSGEVQSRSPLHGSAKWVPPETGGRLAWKHQTLFVHARGFYLSELQADFQTSHASAVWWTWRQTWSSDFGKCWIWITTGFLFPLLKMHLMGKAF